MPMLLQPEIPPENQSKGYKDKQPLQDVTLIVNGDIEETTYSSTLGEFVFSQLPRV